MLLKLLLLLFLLPQKQPLLLDQIAAVVGDQVITRSDIDKAIAFYPLVRQKDQDEEAFRGQVLQELIRYKIIWLEFHGDFNLSEDDYEQVQAPIMQKLGAMEKLQTLLSGLQMQWSDFRSFIAERVLFEKVVREKFPANIPISFAEVEEFYNREYLPSLLQLELAPRSLVEMAPMIEKRLRKAKTDEQLNTWIEEIAAGYTVEIKRRGGK